MDRERDRKVLIKQLNTEHDIAKKQGFLEVLVDISRSDCHQLSSNDTFTENNKI